MKTDLNVCDVLSVNINVTLRLFRDHQHGDISQLFPEMNIELSSLLSNVTNLISTTRILVRLAGGPNSRPPAGFGEASPPATDSMTL